MCSCSALLHGRRRPICVQTIVVHVKHHIGSERYKQNRHQQRHDSIVPLAAHRSLSSLIRRSPNEGMSLLKQFCLACADCSVNVEELQRLIVGIDVNGGCHRRVATPHATRVRNKRTQCSGSVVSA